MILPTKHISTQHSILGAGATVLKNIDAPQTVTALWERVRGIPEVGAYWRFILVLDFLFIVGVLDLADGLIIRRKS